MSELVILNSKIIRILIAEKGFSSLNIEAEIKVVPSQIFGMIIKKIANTIILIL